MVKKNTKPTDQNVDLVERPGDLDKSTLGHPGKYTYCIAENEEASPWAPYHVEQGYAPEDSTNKITITYCPEGGIPMTDDKAARIWQRLKEIMNYSDEDMEKFKSNPKFLQMMSTPAFRTHKIVAEVIESRGCVCQHRVGQRIVLNGNGALLRDECPPIMCIGLVAQLPPAIAAIWERFVAGLDPNGLLIDTIGCSDVGIDCGGWGRVIAKVHAEGPKEK